MHCENLYSSFYIILNVFIFQEKIVKKLASSDPKEQECGKILADEILERNVQRDIREDDVKIKTNRSLINKYPSENVSSSDSDKISRGR